MSTPEYTLCKPCGVVLAGCSICLSNIACRTCKNGFVLSQNSCRSCSQLIANCSRCSTDGKICSACRYPYVLTQDNTCVSGTVDMINMGAETINSTPKTVRLNNGSIVNAVLDSKGCNQVQVYWGGKCIKHIPQCQIYQSDGLCKLCHMGYIVSIFGDCSINDTQLRCENGYWLNRL